MLIFVMMLISVFLGFLSGALVEDINSLYDEVTGTARNKHAQGHSMSKHNVVALAPLLCPGTSCATHADTITLLEESGLG